MTEKQILVKGLSINYKIFPARQSLGLPVRSTQTGAGGGQGKPFLILHGWGSKSERWEKVGELLSEKGFFVVVPDLPGFGKSQEPATAWNLDNYVEWLHEFSEKVLELNKSFYLFGHSFGGSIAIKFSIKYNQRVEKLFLASAAFYRRKTLGKKVSYKVAKIVKIFSFLPYYDLARKAVYKFVLRKSDYPYVSGVMKDTYINVISENLSLHFPFLKVFTIIIWGDKDELTPLKDARFVHEKLHRSTLCIIPNVGHNLDRHDRPELLAQKILENV